MSVGSGAILKDGKVQVTFWPEGERVRVPLEATLLDAGKIAGVDLASSCGGDGLCGKCRVVVRQGNVTAQPTSTLCPAKSTVSWNQIPLAFTPFG